ncbi:hypothetical protein GCM10022212_05060 [Actimicrobium antarcticum]|uniref:Uncharacterized protein n=2 Tax=Actimicrobium antarcticum TaxID=1051899 RepID=A0ABP7SN16_9BURK
MFKVPASAPITTPVANESSRGLPVSESAWGTQEDKRYDANAGPTGYNNAIAATKSDQIEFMNGNSQLKNYIMEQAKNPDGIKGLFEKYKRGELETTAKELGIIKAYSEDTAFGPNGPGEDSLRQQFNVPTPIAPSETSTTAGVTATTTTTTTVLPDRLPQSITATEPSTETDVYPLDVGTQQYQSFIAGMFMPGDFKTAIEKMDPKDQFFKDMASREKFTAIYNDDFKKPEVFYKYFNKDGTLTPDGMVAEAFAMQLKSHDNPILFNKLDGAKNFVVANNPVAPAAGAPLPDTTFNEQTCIDTLKDSDYLFNDKSGTWGSQGQNYKAAKGNGADLNDLYRVSTDPGVPADVRNAAKWLLSHPKLLQKVMGDDSKFSRDDMSNLKGLQTSEKTAPSLDPLLEQKDVGPGSVITTNAEAKAAMQDRNSGEMSYADLITWINDGTVSEKRKNAARYILAHPDYFIQICGGKSTFRIENMS